VKNDKPVVPGIAQPLIDTVINSNVCPTVAAADQSVMSGETQTKFREKFSNQSHAVKPILSSSAR
jgi:hypothetical protein